MLVQKVNNSLSFADRLKGAIAEKKSSEDTLLILDCSGSMSEQYDGKSKYEYLLNAVSEINTKKLYFNSRVSFTSMSPAGGTDLAAAICAIPHGTMRAILVSDGLPDNEEHAIQAAIYRGVPIDIIFIGDSPQGRAFMERLASITGGSSTNIKVEQIHLLKNKLLALKGGQQ